jgi:uncharacterized repeat protein (TIGR04002 family)
LVTVSTFYIRIPSHNGYIHIGDAIIYLMAGLIPTPLAAIGAAIGGALADTLGGYTLYIVPTFVIKMLIVLPFNSKGNRILTRRNLFALPVAAAITMVGYYFAEAVLVALSSSDGFAALLSPVPWTTALYCIPANIIQAVGSTVFFVAIALALDKIDIKGKI